MKKNIFISSTYIDLQQHRKLIWQLLENFDANVLGMEKFGARKETPLNTCISEVSRADIYVGIISHRLGSIEPISQKSYTQLEYEKAVELDKEILIYLIDNEASVSAQYIDFGEKHEQLECFKLLLKEKHTVDFFRDSKDIAEKLSNRLSDLATKISDESVKNTLEHSKNILEKFHLFPGKYSDREIYIKIKVTEKAFPLSKKACDILGFSFGETIGIPINIVIPSVNNQIKYLIVPENLSDFYFDLENEEEVEILGRLIFSEKRVGNIEASFFDNKKTKTKPNPHYDPNMPNYQCDINSFSLYQYQLNNPKYITEEVIVEREGTPILSFIKKI